MREIKFGRDRKVIVDKDSNIVIKIATNERGLEQNYNEFILNKRRPDITARVLFYGGEFLIMEWVDVNIPNLQYDDRTSISGTTEEKARNHKWWAVHCELDKELGTSLDNDQIGQTKDGRVVAYDYGGTEKLIKKGIIGNKENDALLNYTLPKWITNNYNKENKLKERINKLDCDLKTAREELKILKEEKAKE